MMMLDTGRHAITTTARLVGTDSSPFAVDGWFFANRRRRTLAITKITVTVIAAFRRTASGCIIYHLSLLGLIQPFGHASHHPQFTGRRRIIQHPTVARLVLVLPTKSTTTNRSSNTMHGGGGGLDPILLQWKEEACVFVL